MLIFVESIPIIPIIPFETGIMLPDTFIGNCAMSCLFVLVTNTDYQHLSEALGSGCEGGDANVKAKEREEMLTGNLTMDTQPFPINGEGRAVERERPRLRNFVSAERLEVLIPTYLQNRKVGTLIKMQNLGKTVGRDLRMPSKLRCKRYYNLLLTVLRTHAILEDWYSDNCVLPVSKRVFVFQGVIVNE